MGRDAMRFTLCCSRLTTGRVICVKTLAELNLLAIRRSHRHSVSVRSLRSAFPHSPNRWINQNIAGTLSRLKRVL
jgi:hypothetical protein